MPFTPSHAVVAIPFARTALPAAAVAAGAMAPDVPLFVPGGVGYRLTHELPWFPLAGLLIALLLLVVWRVVLRPVAADLLPGPIAARLPEDWRRPEHRGLGSLPSTAVGWILLLAALELGVLTHVVWDEFTHVGRLGARLLPVLDMDGPLHIAWASLLQYASSALGLLGVGVYLVVWLVRRSPRDRVAGATRVAGGVWLVVALTAAVGAVLGAERASGPGSYRIDVIVSAVTGGMGAGAVALVAASIVLLATRPPSAAA